jgi:hypothetical protein
MALWFGILLPGPAAADDPSSLTETGFRAFAVEDLDLRIAARGGADVIAVANEPSIPGYPLSMEELNLVMATPEPAAGFGRPGRAPDFAVDPMNQPLRVRLMGWIKQRSNDFGLFRLLSADDSRPGMRLDVDTEQEELVLEYRIGF